ncbi:MAG TPA: hypothetical protein VF406_21230 [Thermodesulfobacteriota bacterium]
MTTELTPNPSAAPAAEASAAQPPAPTRADIERIHELREALRVRKAELDAAHELVDEAFAAEREQIAALTEQLDAAVEDVKARAVALFIATKREVRTPAPGLQVKVFKEVEVLDAAAMLAFAKQHVPLAVREVVDEKVLLRALGDREVPFLRRTEDPRAQLATDLGAALLKADLKPTLAPAVEAAIEQARASQGGGAR